jgi:hypothetical protein
MKDETGLPLATKRVYTTDTLICQLYYQNAVKKNHFFTYSIGPTMSLTIIEVCEKVY